MVIVPIEVDGEKKGLYLDGTIHGQLMNKVVPSVQKRDFDYFFVVDGEEGSGKSVFAFSLAKVLDPNFSLENIAFTADQFIKIVTSAKRHSCVVFDEAFTGLSSRSSLSEINRLLVSLMMEMRQRNLFVIIVMPTFFMLERYVVLHRSRCLFHVYINRKGKRGFWAFYDRRNMRWLYDKGKKFFDYTSVKSPLQGRFVNTYTINEAGYREMKRSALTLKRRKTRADVYKHQRDILFFVLNQNFKMSQRKIIIECKKADYVITQQNLSIILRKMNNLYLNEDE